MKKTRLLVLTITQVAALTVMILTATLFFPHQQQGIAQGQQQEKLSPSNQRHLIYKGPFKIYPLRLIT